MRSFRLHNPRAIVPGKLVSEYSDVEREAFEEAFKRQAEGYRASSKKAKKCVNVCFLLWGTAVLVGALVHSSRSFICFGIAGGLAWLYGVFNYPRWLNCPACSQNLLEGFGQFCPECNGRLGRVSFFDSATCSCCTKKLTLKSGPNFKIRYCTYCGLKLVDEGL